MMHAISAIENRRLGQLAVRRARWLGTALEERPAVHASQAADRPHADSPDWKPSQPGLSMRVATGAKTDPLSQNLVAFHVSY
jgi:hypothetical protein